MMSKFVSLYGHDKAVTSRQPAPPADSGRESDELSVLNSILPILLT